MFENIVKVVVIDYHVAVVNWIRQLMKVLVVQCALPNLALP